MRTFEPNELEKRIDEVLYYVWDPIGVADSPYARDEYSPYVPAILTLVIDKSSAETISAHLNDIVRNNIGLSPNEDNSLHTAELILEHKKAIDEGCA
jgi:hypothetical protein